MTDAATASAANDFGARAGREILTADDGPQSSPASGLDVGALRAARRPDEPVGAGEGRALEALSVLDDSADWSRLVVTGAGSAFSTTRMRRGRSTAPIAWTALVLAALALGAPAAAGAPAISVAVDRLELGLDTTTTVTVVTDQSPTGNDRVFVGLRANAETPCAATPGEERAARRDYVDLLAGRQLAGSGQVVGRLVPTLTLVPGPARICGYFAFVPAGTSAVAHAIADLPVQVGAGSRTDGPCPVGTPGGPGELALPATVTAGREFRVTAGGAAQLRGAGGEGVRARTNASDPSQLLMRVAGPPGPRPVAILSTDTSQDSEARCTREQPVTVTVVAGVPLRPVLNPGPRDGPVSSISDGELRLVEWHCPTAAVRPRGSRVTVGPTRIELTVRAVAGLARPPSGAGARVTFAEACRESGSTFGLMPIFAGPPALVGRLRPDDGFELDLPRSNGRYLLELRQNDRLVRREAVAIVFARPLGGKRPTWLALSAGALNRLACTPALRQVEPWRRALLGALPVCRR